MCNLILFAGSSKYSELIWNWRNDPITREYSFCDKFITWEEHKIWYQKVLEDISTKLFIGEINDEPVGVIRFRNLRDNKSTYEININIAPIYRGKGIGKKLLKSSLIKIREYDHKIDTVIANVKTNNKASKSLFKKSGFTLVKNDTEKCFYSLKINDHF